MCVVIGLSGHYYLIKGNLLKLLFFTTFVNIAKSQASKEKAFNSALQKVVLDLFI